LAIYRGAGGSGDAINDASSEALLTVQAKNAALAAQAAAETAQTAAQLAETNAETAETNAETAETNAETAATNAASSASAASTSASNASSSASAASTSASNASTSATNASNSASAASTSATNASNSASAASTSASNASTSATNASNSASAAATSATNAAASYDAFDDRYLGSKSSNPTVDNDGNALLAGALYYNTTAPEMRVYNGTSWTFIGSGASAGVESFNTRTGAVTLSSSDVTTALTYTPLAPSAIGTTVQAYDADLTTLGAGGSSARSFLGLVIGTDVQAYDAQLADIAGLTPSDNNFIVGNGTNFVTESGSTARTSLGLGSIATQDASNVTITGGSVSGITDLAIADGGTGASDTATARTNLGLAIGTNVQAWDADLDTWATKTAPSGTVVGTSDSQTLTNKTLTNPTINGFTGDTSVINIGSGQVYKDTSGNVGIGTSSPTEKLHVSSGAIRISNTSNSLLELNTNAGNRFGYLFGTSSSVQLAAESTANNVLSFSTAGAERMRITSAGGVSFGSSGTAYGTSGQVLQSNGDAAPTWVTAASGATVSSSSSDITLTSSSNRLQQVAMTGYGLQVILPDATTITTLGTPRFVINNDGYIAFDIAVSTGGRLFGLAGGQSVEISLSSNSDATSGWVATPIGQMAITQTIQDNQPATFYTSSMFTSGTTLLSNATADMNSTSSTITSVNYLQMTCVALSTTSVMAVWIAPSTGYPTACVGTISGTTISWGTPAVVNNARAYATVKMCALSSTTGLISISSGANFYNVGFSVSGTTLTFSTISAATNATLYNIVTVTSTTALIGYSTGARVVTYNGASAPTLGTGLAITWSANNNSMGLVPLTATTFLAGWCSGNADINAVVFTVSGTTVTRGTIVSVSTGNATYYGNGNLISISSTEAVYVIANQWQRWTVSGTTVTAGANNLIRLMNDTWQNLSWNNFIMAGVTSQLIGSTDFIALTPSQGIVRGSYNSASLSAKGYSLCANSCLPFAVCTVSTTRGLVVGLSTRSDGTNNYYPTGYLVDLNG
jgi:hypothetical protein